MAQLFESICEFFEIDTRKFGGDILYFHPGLNEFNLPVKWTRYEVVANELVLATRTYEPLPIEIRDVSYDGDGRVSRPQLLVGDETGLLSALVAATDNLSGCPVTYRSTWGYFLDAENFDGGNPRANPAMQFPAEVFYISRVADDVPSTTLTFELSSGLTLPRAKLPKNNYAASVCAVPYRGALCGYTGSAMFDIYDKPTDDPAKDQCSRRVSGCECRFGKGKELRCRIFPGAQLVSMG